ncbi:hypothetical protein GCM10029964_086480 [Kibdelosporangium lantanae]
MGCLVVIGEPARVLGFALIGAVVLNVENPESARNAWHAMPADTEVVLLTSMAAQGLRDEITAPGAPLTAVMEEAIHANP